MDPLVFRRGPSRAPEDPPAPLPVSDGPPDDDEERLTSASRDYTPNAVPVPARGEAQARDDLLAGLTALAAATDQLLQSLPVVAGCDPRTQVLPEWLAGLGGCLLGRAAEVRDQAAALAGLGTPLRDMHGPCGGAVRCVASLSFALTRAVAVARATRGLLRDRRCADEVVGCVQALPQHFAVPALVDRVANWAPGSVRLDAGLPDGCAAAPAALLQAGLAWGEVKRLLAAGPPASDGGDRASAADHVVADLCGALWDALVLVTGALVLESDQHAVFSLSGVSVPFARHAYLIGWPAKLLDFDELYQLCVASGLDEPPLPEAPGGAWDCRGFPCLRTDAQGPPLGAIIRLAPPGTTAPSLGDLGPFPEARVRIGNRQHALPLAEFCRRLQLAEPWFFRADRDAAPPATDDDDDDADDTLQCFLAPWDEGRPGEEVQLIACGALGMVREAFRCRQWPAPHGFLWVVSPVDRGVACPRCPAPFTTWSPSQLFTLTPATSALV